MAHDHVYDRPVADQFAAFADVLQSESPLYTTLSRAIVDDPELLDLARGTIPGQPPPNVLFAAVQYLLLSGVSHQLVAWYPDLGGSISPGGDPVPVFRDFCLSHRDELASLIATRRTQTNEVARCVALLPAFGVAGNKVGTPMALIEIGASAGLLLAFDRYRYVYGGEAWGPESAPVVLTTELRGQQPPLPDGLAIESRTGIDLFPLDVSSADDARWLDALVWPGHEERRTRLRAALGLVAPAPPRILAGDALELLPELLAAVPADVTPVVYHSFALIQWSNEQRARLDDLLRAAGRRVIRIWLEWFGYQRNRPLIRLFEYDSGAEIVETLGRSHHHGRWLDWGWTEPDG